MPSCGGVSVSPESKRRLRGNSDQFCLFCIVAGFFVDKCVLTAIVKNSRFCLV
jgi:hypothetical protein